jgi:hypothetical protein
LKYPTMCVYWHVQMFLSPLESFQWTRGFVLRRYMFLHALPPSVTRIRECFQELSQILFKFLQSFIWIGVQAIFKQLLLYVKF